MPDLSIDNKLNLIFGIFATTTGTLGCLLAWAAWKLAYGRRERREEYDGWFFEYTPRHIFLTGLLQTLHLSTILTDSFNNNNQTHRLVVGMS